jgi:peptide-methionine (S)-S-oxide reductase
MGNNSQVATLAGGCFWCLEAVYEEVSGVEKVVSGYSGGHVKNPTYEAVCSETTGHAEAVQITFDPEEVSYKSLVDIFFSIHDPTTLNRQGNDIGSQYRSAVFCHDEKQKIIVEELIQKIGSEEDMSGPVVTEVIPAPTFYPAEEYHQQYYRRNQWQGYCQIVISPKLAKFRKQFISKKS